MNRMVMMTRAKGNFEHNYPLVIKWLEDNGIEYAEYNGGQQLKILGPVAMIELWPSRMTYHVIASESVQDTKYRRLSFYFKQGELQEVLNGGGVEL